LIRIAFAVIIQQNRIHSLSRELAVQYPDLSPSSQILLLVVLACAWAALLVRVGTFFRRKRVGVRLTCPGIWTTTQCRTLEGFRLLTGLGLIVLWVSFFFVVPSLPTNWPFGYLEAILLITLLLMSYAWLLFLVPRNWKVLGGIAQSFRLTMIVFAVWWTVLFTATGWILVKAQVPSPRLNMPTVGVFAQGSSLDVKRVVLFDS
jgi:hypothetical protein